MEDDGSCRRRRKTAEALAALVPWCLGASTINAWRIRHHSGQSFVTPARPLRRPSPPSLSPLQLLPIHLLLLSFGSTCCSVQTSQSYYRDVFDLTSLLGAISSDPTRSTPSPWWASISPTTTVTWLSMPGVCLFLKLPAQVLQLSAVFMIRVLW